MRGRFFGGSWAEGEALAFAASPSFSSLSEEKGFTAGWRLSSVFFFGEDWGKSFEKEEEEEDIATGGEGFWCR
jgi:hypothetical protein